MELLELLDLLGLIEHMEPMEHLELISLLISCYPAFFYINEKTDVIELIRIPRQMNLMQMQVLMGS